MKSTNDAIAVINQDLQILKDKLERSSETEKDWINCRMQELTDLISEAEKNKDSIVGVPFVIVTMTHQQVSELIDESVFANNKNSDLHKRFQDFKGKFTQAEISIWDSHYTKEQDAWKPLFCSDKTIKDIIFETVLNSLNPIKQAGHLFYPVFHSVDFFHSNKIRREQICCELEEVGCIMILDALSLFHPDLCQALIRSEFMTKKQIAVITLSPVKYVEHEADLAIKKELNSQLERAFHRFDMHLDQTFEVGVRDIHTLKRWLFAILPKVPMILQEPQLHPDNREFVSQNTGNMPTRINGFFYGPGGRR